MQSPALPDTADQAVTRAADDVPADVGTRSIVVLDTCVLITDPKAIFAYPDADVVVPLIVIEELDRKKTQAGDVGFNARETLRQLDDLAAECGRDLREALPLPGGGTVRIEPNGVHMAELRKFHLDAAKPDNRIIAAAIGRQSEDGRHVTLVSNDTAVRIKATQCGLASVSYQEAEADIDAVGVGWSEVEVGSDLVDAVYADGELPAAALDGADAAPTSARAGLLLKAGSQSAMLRRDGQVWRRFAEPEAGRLKARNVEQKFALDLLLDPDVRIVALDGKAGTGKTLVSLAAGLHQVESMKRYSQVAVFRPMVAVGRDTVGYLPGELDAKIAPWMAAVTDAIGAMSGTSPAQAQTDMEKLARQGKLTLEVLQYLRGRTLGSGRSPSFILIDEAQNLEPATLKTVLTRLGENSKVVFTGDVSQIDAPYLTSRTNALSVLLERFADQPLFGHVRLQRCERSEVASLAADLL